MRKECKICRSGTGKSSKVRVNLEVLARVKECLFRGQAAKVSLVMGQLRTPKQSLRKPKREENSPNLTTLCWTAPSNGEFHELYDGKERVMLELSWKYYGLSPFTNKNNQGTQTNQKLTGLDSISLPKRRLLKI